MDDGNYWKARYPFWWVCVRVSYPLIGLECESVFVILTCTMIYSSNDLASFEKGTHAPAKQHTPSHTLSTAQPACITQMIYIYEAVVGP